MEIGTAFHTLVDVVAGEQAQLPPETAAEIHAAISAAYPSDPVPVPAEEASPAAELPEPEPAPAEPAPVGGTEEEPWPTT